MSRQLAVLAALTLVLAGCAAPVTPPTAGDWTWPDDPPSDRLGWENGYWYNESIAVDQSDGLDEREREMLVARTMARVERVRGLEFTERVPVEVVSREQYRQNRQSRSTQSDRNADYRAWNDQVWEALLLVGENREVSDVLEELYGGSVLGFYSPSRERIVVVSDSATPQIDRATLAHELVHALQDQQFGLSSNARTQDGQLARQGIVEGDARYVEYLYEDRCERGTFDCIPTPEVASGGGGGAGSLSAPGVFVTIYTPYSEGPALVDRLYRRGGWDAVNEVYENPPASTEQLIHPETYPDETPVDVSVPDRSAGNWSRFDLNPQGDTVGEASLFAMLWQNGYVDRSSFQQDTGEYSAYNYTHPASAGWGGDRIVPYRSDSGEYGYVWALEWDTPQDARAFVSAYESVLVDQLGGERVEPGIYRVPEDRPFGDAFRVTRRGTRVTIVNAPSVSELDAVHRTN